MGGGQVSKEVVACNQLPYKSEIEKCIPIKNKEQQHAVYNYVLDKVQWATKVMTPTSMYFLWKQGL